MNGGKSRFDSKTRNMVRKAEKAGTETREIVLRCPCPGIWGIYKRVSIRQGKPFSTTARAWSSERALSDLTRIEAIFIGTFLGEQLIGFVKLTTDAARVQSKRDEHNINDAAQSQGCD